MSHSIVISNADTIEEGDTLVFVNVRLRVTANQNAYARSIGEVKWSDFREDIIGEVMTRIENGHGFLENGIVTDIEVA